MSRSPGDSGTGLIVSAALVKNGRIIEAEKRPHWQQNEPIVSPELVNGLKLPGNGQKATCSLPGEACRGFGLSVYVTEQMQYMCIFKEGEASKLRIIYSFLNEIKDKTSVGCPSPGQDLKDSMSHWNSGTADKFTTVNMKLDKLKDTMKKNMELVLIRGDQLDSVLAQSQQVADSASQFQNQAKQAHCMMFKRHWKWNAMIAGALLVLILFIVILTQA